MKIQKKRWMDRTERVMDGETENRLFIYFHLCSREAKHLVRCTINLQTACRSTALLCPELLLFLSFLTLTQLHKFHQATERDELIGIFHPFFSAINYSLYLLGFTPTFKMWINCRQIKVAAMVTEMRDKQNGNNPCDLTNTHGVIIFTNESSQCFLAGERRHANEGITI